MSPGSLLVLASLWLSYAAPRAAQCPVSVLQPWGLPGAHPAPAAVGSLGQPPREHRCACVAPAVPASSPPPALPHLVIPFLRTLGTRAGATRVLWCFAVRCRLLVLVGCCSQCIAVRFWCCWGWGHWGGRKEEAGRN